MQTQSEVSRSFPQAGLGLARVFDVASDDWLGRANNLRLIAQGRDASSAVGVDKNGAVRGLSKAARALRHAMKVGQRAQDAGDAQVRKLMEISAEFGFQKAVNTANDALYRELKVGETFVLVEYADHAKEPQRVTKVDRFFPGKRGRDFYPHREEVNGEGSVSCFMSRPANLVLMTAQAYERWHAEELEQAQRMGEELGDYRYAQQGVNAEVLRMAAVLGPKAVAHPFDADKREATVSYGKWVVRFVQDFCDMMEVKIERSGKVVSERTGMVSVRMTHESTGAIFSRGYSYNELGCAAYDAWVEARGVRGQRTAA